MNQGHGDSQGFIYIIVYSHLTYDSIRIAYSIYISGELSLSVEKKTILPVVVLTECLLCIRYEQNIIINIIDYYADRICQLYWNNF